MPDPAETGETKVQRRILATVAHSFKTKRFISEAVSMRDFSVRNRTDFQNCVKLFVIIRKLASAALLLVRDKISFCKSVSFILNWNAH